MTSSINRDFVIAVLMILIAMITIQSGASFAKNLFPLIGPEGTTALRLGFSAIILWFIFRPWRALPKAGEWRGIIFYGACLGGMNLLFYYAIARIPLGIGVALEFIGPLSVALFSSKRKRDLFWVACAVVGIVLLLPISSNTESLDPIGVILALLAGVCWAGYIIFGKRTGNQGSGGITVTLGLTFAALFIVPFGVVSQGAQLFTWEVIPLGIGIAILSSAIPYTLEMKALKIIPTSVFSIMMSLEPAIAAVAGFIILGELLTLNQWIAVLLVIAASVGSSLPSKIKTDH